MKNYSKAKELLRRLAINAEQAIKVIDADPQDYEICDELENIEGLVSQISSCILGQNASFINNHVDIKH